VIFSSFFKDSRVFVASGDDHFVASEFDDKEPLTRDNVSPSCEEEIWVELCNRVVETANAEDDDDNIETSS